MVAVNGGIEWGFDAPSHLSASCTQPLAILAGWLAIVHTFYTFIRLYSDDYKVYIAIWLSYINSTWCASGVKV